MSFGDLPGDLEHGDRLFNVGGPWQFNAKMALDFLRDYRYVEGFRRAAEVLGDQVARDRGDVDALAMPILFCYRQWLELRLKDLWLQGGRLGAAGVEPLQTHDLRVLWRHVRPVLEEAWPEGDRDELDRLETVLHELANLDGPQGIGFRYATDREGRASLPPGLEINLHNVRTVMGKVRVLLDGASEGLGVMLEYQAEMRAYDGGE
jgi:hypothetical protein